MLPSHDRWELIPEAQRTSWTNTKYWWKREYLRVKPSMAARQAGYGMKATEEQQATEDAQYNQAVAQFASGHAASQGSISNLTATNAAQQQQILALQAQLTQSANNVSQVMYQPPAQQQMQYQQPMQQQQQGRGRGGRNGGRGNRNNNGWQGQAWGQLQQLHSTMQPNVNFGASGGGSATQTQKTPYRIFSNYNYCKSCGGHIHDDHTSMTCKTPGPNHDRNATRQNMMGGSTAGMHKTIMPEQCGRVANRHPQPEPSQGYLS